MKRGSIVFIVPVIFFMMILGFHAPALSAEKKPIRRTWKESLLPNELQKKTDVLRQCVEISLCTSIPKISPIPP